MTQLIEISRYLAKTFNMKCENQILPLIKIIYERRKTGLEFDLSNDSDAKNVKVCQKQNLKL